MAEHFDSLETRDPALRERMQFADLPRQVAYAQAASSAFAKILAGVDAAAVNSRDALARLPVTRKSALLEMQKVRAAVRRPGHGCLGCRAARVRVARSDLRA